MQTLQGVDSGWPSVDTFGVTTARLKYTLSALIFAWIGVALVGCAQPMPQARLDPAGGAITDSSPRNIVSAPNASAITGAPTSAVHASDSKGQRIDGAKPGTTGTYAIAALGTLFDTPSDICWENLTIKADGTVSMTGFTSTKAPTLEALTEYVSAAKSWYETTTVEQRKAVDSALEALESIAPTFVSLIRAAIGGP